MRGEKRCSYVWKVENGLVAGRGVFAFFGHPMGKISTITTTTTTTTKRAYHIVPLTIKYVGQAKK